MVRKQTSPLAHPRPAGRQAAVLRVERTGVLVRLGTESVASVPRMACGTGSRCAGGVFPVRLYLGAAQHLPQRVQAAARALAGASRRGGAGCPMLLVGARAARTADGTGG